MGVLWADLLEDDAPFAAFGLHRDPERLVDRIEALRKYPKHPVAVVIKLVPRSDADLADFDLDIHAGEPSGAYDAVRRVMGPPAGEPKPRFDKGIAPYAVDNAAEPLATQCLDRLLTRCAVRSV